MNKSGLIIKYLLGLCNLRSIFKDMPAKMISESLWYEVENNTISPLHLFLLTNHKAIIFSVVKTLVYKIFY